jgi:4-carboxymuconolactone decarboxylase
MTRIPPLPPETLPPDSKRIYDEIAGPRHGTVNGPFAIWMRTPAIADRANQLGNQLRGKSTIEPRLFELMVLTVARTWSAQYEWHAHEPAARAAGLDNAVIEAIRARRKPAFERDDERVVYDTVSELNERRVLSQATYDRALALFGTERLIELIADAGFYTMVAMTLDAFDAPVPGGAQPLPLP